MLKNKSEIQRIGIAVCAVIIIGSLIFSAFARLGYSRLSQDKANIDNATLSFNEEAVSYIDYENTTVTYEELKQELENYSCVFKVKVNDLEYCHQCLKFTVEIMQCIKGDESEGNTAVLYQLGGITAYDDSLIYESYDNSMPLKIGGEYLVFADKRDYDEDYQATLDCNEYSLALMGSGPSAFILNEVQQDYITSPSEIKYSDLSGIYYTCFSQSALDNLNDLSAQIAADYE